GDNWDVGGIQLWAELGCEATAPPPTTSVTLLNADGSTLLDDGSLGLCREKADQHDCKQPISVPAGLSASDTIDSLTISIETGEANLEGGDSPESNTAIDLAGFPTTFTDVNVRQEWRNGEFGTFYVAPMPSTPVTLGDFDEINVKTKFSGGSASDN